MSVSANQRHSFNRDLGWTKYVWLIFLPAFFVQPVLNRTSAVEWTAHVVASLIFLATYLRGQWVAGPALLPSVLVPLAFGIGFSPVNPGAYVFFTYAASFAARFDRTRDALAWIAGITVVGLVVAFEIDAPLYFWLSHGVFTPLIGAVTLHFAQVGRANDRLHAAHDEIEHLAAVAERERIARDLHDVLGHTLSLIVLKAELASKLAERDPVRAVKEIRDVESVSRQALKEVREAIRGYRPTLTDEIARAQTLLSAARIGVTVDASIEAEALKVREGAEEVLALALREAVTNVVRHSGASRATIRAWRETPSGRAFLEVADDGRGTGRPEGAGLRGMRERVEAIDGCVTSMSESGTRLTVAIPLAAARHGVPA